MISAPPIEYLEPYFDISAYLALGVLGVKKRVRTELGINVKKSFSKVQRRTKNTKQNRIIAAGKLIKYRYSPPIRMASNNRKIIPRVPIER